MHCLAITIHIKTEQCVQIELPRPFTPQGDVKVRDLTMYLRVYGGLKKQVQQLSLCVHAQVVVGGGKPVPQLVDISYLVKSTRP